MDTSSFVITSISLILIISFCLYEKPSQKESFIPSIQKMYQPHIRKARLFTEKMTNHFKKHFSHYSKKKGII